MNRSRASASVRVQCAQLIISPRLSLSHSACGALIPEQEFAMLKIITAAVVAASVLVEPAMAATVIKTEKPTTHSRVLKPSVANANARGVVVMMLHHHMLPHHRVVTM